MDALNWSHIITKLVSFSGKFPDIATRRSVPVILSSALGSEWSAMLHSERTHRDKFLSTESCGLQHRIAECNFPEFRKFLPNFLLRYSITWTDIVESSNTQKQIAQWTPASNLSRCTHEALRCLCSKYNAKMDPPVAKKTALHTP